MPEHGCIFQYFKLTEEQKKLIEDNISLLYSYLRIAVRDHKIRYEEKDELEGILNIKLCQAARTYDINKGSVSNYFYKAFHSGLVCYYSRKTKYTERAFAPFPTYEVRDQFNMEYETIDVEYSPPEDKCNWEEMENLFKMASIKGRDSVILKLRYRDNLYMYEIGQILNISKQRVMQTCNKCIKKLSRIVRKNKYQMEDFMCI